MLIARDMCLTGKIRPLFSFRRISVLKALWITIQVYRERERERERAGRAGKKKSFFILKKKKKIKPYPTACNHGAFCGKCAAGSYVQSHLAPHSPLLYQHFQSYEYKLLPIK